MQDDELTELESQKKRENEIIKENEQSFMAGRASKFDNDQTEEALKQTAKNKINDLYYGRVFPYTNAVIYLIYYISSLVALPLIYFRKEKMIAVIFFSILLVALIISREVEKKVRINIKKENESIKRLIRFADQTSMFSYMLTSLGYIITMLSKPGFWVIFSMMVIVFVIGIYYEVLKPIFRKNHNEHS